MKLTLENGKEIEESHMFPVRSFEKHPRQNRSNAKDVSVDKLNIVFLMIDSLSHSGAVRFLPKHYKDLKEDPDSVIMEVSLSQNFCISRAETFFVNEKF